MGTELYDVVVIGGSPIGLSAAYEVAKKGAKVVILEQNNFFNQAGSSGDLARMFRTMYTEDFMADLAKETLGLWDALEKDAGTSLRWMSGLLNFGDKDYGGETPEGTLLGPVPNLERLGRSYQKLTAKEIENRAKKIIIASGAYVNHVLRPSFGLSLDLDIWEMVASYFNTNAGPNGTIFPSMWFQFAPDKNDIRDSQDFIRQHLVGVDSTVPALTLSCLQTNVFDNMFVLDFIPEEYLRGGAKDSVVVFTAGWAMKFVPIIGKALAEMALHGRSKYARKEFSITRMDPETGKGIIVDDERRDTFRQSSFAFTGQASGSSIRGLHNTSF
ncbi:hypothetical protein AAE478_009463 [Parahypoxylon ruwenzoriense]